MLPKGVVKLSEFASLGGIEKLDTNLPPFDKLTGGLVKGGICEVFGLEGSGKRSLVISLLANFTGNNEICVIVDTTNSFDPVSASRNGMNLKKVLWVKCDGDPKKAIIAADYLIQSNLFRAIWLDLGLCDIKFLDKLPNSYWFRFKVGLKDTETTLLITLNESRLNSASHQSVEVSKVAVNWKGEANFKVPTETVIRIELREPERKTEYISIIEDYL